MVIWFVNSTAELEWEIRRISGVASGVPMWIAWRKKTAARAPRAGPTESAVREAGLAAGLVDYKVCAIDATWSGLLFAQRKSSR
jgi:hypothetical protein